MQARYPDLGRDLVDGVVRRHGTRTPKILGDARSAEALGQAFGAGLTQREIEYLIAEELAETAEDVLWRRTKCGLHMTAQQADAVADFLRQGASAP